MENLNEKLKQKIIEDKNIFQDNMNNIQNFVNSVNENSQNYLKFNESLFINHNKWLYDVQKQLNTAINEKSTNINLKDLYYEDSILSLLKKIAKPNNYRNIKSKNMDEKIDNYGLFKKIDELANFNDVIDTINTCSKYKRESLLSNIHKNNYKEDKNEENVVGKDIEADNKIDIEEKKIESFEKDEDINMNDLIAGNEKNKFENLDYPYDINEKDENSLCTIVEQPSIEEKDKNTKISLSNKNIFAPKSNQNTIKNNNNNSSNYVLQLNSINSNNTNSNNSSSNKLNTIKNIVPDNNTNLKQLNPFESFSTPQKTQSPNFNFNNNNNNILVSSNKDNLLNTNSIEKSPCFGAEIKCIDYNTKKKNISPNNFMMPNAPLFSFGKSYNMISSQKSLNKNDFIFSTEKKFENNFSNNKFGCSSNKNDIIVLHTSIKKGKENKFLSDIKSKNFCLSDNKINGNSNYCSVVSLKKKNNQNLINSNNSSNNSNNNFINILTNSINKVNEDNNTNSKNNDFNNNNNFINIITHSINNINEDKGINSENNGFERKEYNSNNKNYVQNIVLSSNKNPPKIYNNNAIKIKEKYEDDFEEYEMSDSSKRADNDEDEEDNTKFVPKWAMDEKYISDRIMKQQNDKDLIMKSFGKFVVDHLNLNMILGTHNEAFDIRNSTADWRGDESFARNKVTNINDNEIDTIFPNRKLQF